MYDDLNTNSSPLTNDEIQSVARLFTSSVQSRIIATIVSGLLIVTWCLILGSNFETLILFLFSFVVISIPTIFYAKVNIIPSANQIRVIRPGVPWSVAVEANLGGALIFSGCYFLVANIVHPSELLNLIIGLIALITAFFLTPLLLLLSQLPHTNWLKSILSVSIDRATGAVTVDLIRISVFDYTLQNAKIDSQILGTLAGQIAQVLQLPPSSQDI